MDIIEASLMFVIISASYGIFSPISGYMSQQVSPKYVSMFGAILTILGFTLMGPLPFLDLKKSVLLIAIGLTLKSCHMTNKNSSLWGDMKSGF